ncbi:ABC transporter substrate-binding protein [Plantactinospora soyae]|uniref:ABC-type glycerol-3-phosphate transport system substrate-binding protein n=1 Tax=Plantactinospora soyae TaxID=1544732 RepID=A0A927MCY1_9ACTN|nr:sugar ABC transporter substrate-binding protein [Plantactinospora soyae]MBE1490836.1 ABC-type glycerol-3-phosphate transport system substrate-binding protein [Plantactinospora soyae]
MRRPLAVLTTALAVTALSLSLSACSDDDGGGGNTLSVLSWDNETTMQPVLDAFRAAHPDITLEMSYSPPVAEYIQTLQTRVLSGKAPDVFLIAAENKTNLINGKHVLDLSNEPFIKGLPEINTKTYGRDDAVYGLSVSSWGAGIMYNKDLLAKVGATEPPQTWDEFLALCARLKGAGITPFLEALDGMPTVLSAFLGAHNVAQGLQMDTRIFNGESTFAREWAEPLRQYNRIFADGLEPSSVAGLKPDQVVDEFATGRVAMFPSGPWNIASIRQKAPDLKFAMVPVPAAPGGSVFLAGAAGPGWAISAKSENVDAARTFLTFLASEQGIKPYQKASNAITVTENFEPPIDEALQPIVANVRAGRFYLPQIAWTRAEDLLNVEAVAQLQLMAQKQATPEEVAAALDRKLATS